MEKERTIDDLLDENPDLPGDFVIRMGSDEFGVEEFYYHNHKEMREGLDRLKDQISQYHKQDGIERELDCFIRLGVWDNNEEEA